MRRVVGWLICLTLITIGLFWPVIFSSSPEAGSADDPVVFSKYQVDMSVDRSGRLDARETITAEFPGDRHGIFKYWDVSNPNNPGVRQIPEVISVTLDGQLVPYRMLVRVPRDAGLPLAAALRRAAGVLSARRDHEPVRVQIDPLHIG